MDYDFKNWINDKVMEYIPSPYVKSGRQINFRCPCCGDSKKVKTKKRGSYYLDSASYYCFNCGVTLSGMKLLKFLSGTDYNDIKVQYLKQKLKNNDYSLSTDFSLSANVNLFDFKPIIRDEWKKPLSAEAREYLKGRKIFDSPYSANVTFYSIYDKKGNEFILIPWTINGVDAYFQLNDFKKLDKFNRKYIFPKNQNKLVFNIDNVDISYPYIFLFEGVYDSLFVKNGCAIGGKNLTSMQKEILEKRYPNHKLVFCLDNDIAGLTAMASNVKNNYKYLKWFDESTKEKDINDFVLSHGDSSMFSDKKFLESHIINAAMMKLFLLSKNIVCK